LVCAPTTIQVRKDIMRNSIVIKLKRGAPVRALALTAALGFACATASAQHEGHTTHPPTPTPTPNKAAAPTPTPVSTPAPTPHDPSRHEHHGAPATTDKKEAQPAKPAEAPAAADHSAHGASRPASDSSGSTRPPTFSGSLLVLEGERMGIRVGASASNVMPMGQMGSGTAWQPASSPTYMWHKNAGEWFLMMHGEAKLGVNRQGGPRGVTKFESQNWIMPMAFRRVGAGTLQLRGMFSLEPLTFSGAGSPQLFQAGEVYRGEPLRDFQHPHDLFMELSATYTLPVGERGTWYAYLALPGEPALGPVAFKHRASASENPSAPLGHHLQDATHISFGVLTTGFTYRWLKLEGSLFNGHEPDEDRYGFEFKPWNSRSVRVSVAPNANWTMQYSYGFLRDPEQLSPGDTHRQTASVQYNRPFARGNFASALIWGRNREGHDGETFRLNSYTGEATVNFLDRNYAYTRLELVDREADDLLSHDELHDLGFGEGAHPRFRIGAFTFGAARDIWNTERWSVALGGDFTFYSKPGLLDALYGRAPTSYKLFLRVRPGRMKHGAAHGGHAGGN
jgi:hypothetical protein